MTLISLVITLIVVGILMYCINTYVPMEATIKKILNMAVVLIVVLWLLSVFGLWQVASIPVPRVR